MRKSNEAVKEDLSPLIEEAIIEVEKEELKGTQTENIPDKVTIKVGNTETTVDTDLPSKYKAAIPYIVILISWVITFVTTKFGWKFPGTSEDITTWVTLLVSFALSIYGTWRDNPITKKGQFLSIIGKELEGLLGSIEGHTKPTTVSPKTAEETTVEPTTVEETTVEPTTVEETTVAPTTVEETTVAPTTVEPTTVDETTVNVKQA
ncbi:lysis protein [Lactobacillus phage SAC12B]|uniref:Lysis protein n=1 Tax=Lactobacillus phage SAC12B TaxID=2510941 RepID=A0A4Y5FFQ6_9CAUD|nr:holin [Lactobacillus phage SAC12B]QBJ03963.1 lysis protein [Lactobacillus phage SAC12B]